MYKAVRSKYLLQIPVAVATTIGIWWLYYLSTRNFVLFTGLSTTVRSEVLMFTYVWPRVIHSIFREYHIVLHINEVRAIPQYITNIAKCPTDDWLTTFVFLTSHVWPNNHQSEILLFI